MGLMGSFEGEFKSLREEIMKANVRTERQVPIHVLCYIRNIHALKINHIL
jgi:hypothetical protein